MTSLQRHTVVALLLCSLGIVAYSAARHNGFVWDDNFQIVRNPFLHSDMPVTRVWLSDVWGYMRGGQVGLSNYYRPLQMMAYRWTATVAGLNPAAFHWLSVLLNILACGAAYLVMWQITRRWALSACAAVLFAIHPMHSEAVLWISALTELGCALFYFLAFWLFLRAVQPPEISADEGTTKRRADKSVDDAPRFTSNKIALIAGACASFLIALLWKEMALTLPVLIAAYTFIFLPSDRSWGTRLRAAVIISLPFWAITVVYVAIRVAVLGYFSKVQHGLSLGFPQMLLNMAVLVGEYWLRLLLPLKLNAFHVFHPVLSLADPRAVLAIVFLAAAIALFIFGLRRAPLAAFAAAWVFITLVPVLNLEGVGENVFAERYLYIPSLGFVLLVALAAATALRRLPAPAARAIAVGGVALASVAAVAQIWHRVPDWASDRALYTNAVQLSPDAPLMRNSLAQIRRDQDRNFPAAQHEYEVGLAESLRQDNDVQAANAYLGLAGIASRYGQFDKALDFVEKGLKQYDLPSLHVGRGILLLQTGHLADARQELERAHEYFPYDEVTLNSLGLIAMMQKDNARAVDYLQQAVNIAPTYADGFNNLGRAYADAGNLPQSIASFQRATELAPQNVQFITNLAVAYARQGRYDEARTQFERALAIAPNFEPALANLRLLQAVQSRGR